MNNYEWLLKEIVRYTYKPGWYLYPVVMAKQYGVGSICEFALQLEAKVRDTNNPENEIVITSMDYIPDDITEYRESEVLAKLIQRLIMNMEAHECREWLRRDGEIYDNPHK